MGTVPTPDNNSEPTTIEVADGHVVHLCCGKLDDEAHRNFCEHFRDGYAEGYLDALAAVAGVSQVETPVDELIDPPACPAWCDGTHRAEKHAPEFRDCESEEMFTPTFKDGVVGVSVTQTFDRVTGRTRDRTIRVEDYEFTEWQARHLGRALLRAADLLAN